MGGNRISKSQEDTFWLAIREGVSIRRAAALANFSEATGNRLMAKPSNGQEKRAAKEQRERNVPDTPVPLDEICPEARAALDDRTGYLFAKRYFGWELSPFQMSVCSALEEAWETDDREYLCLNGPPGLGKSTAFVVFAAKRIVQWRAIRVMFMSRAVSLARKNSNQLRRALERTNPAVDAASTLSADFGRFKPRHGGDIWTRDEYVVEQMDGEPIEMKEATVTAFGFESEWLGNRIDLLIGDDLDSTKAIRNLDVVEQNREIYDNELEPRIGEGGLFVIGQQRLGAFDFSAHVLAKVVIPDDDGTDEDRAEDGVHLYRRLVYKVHYDDRCRGIETHRHPAPAYPDGCLLDPRRMPWSDVRKAMGKPDTFKVVYQQEDPGTDDALVQRVWVDGGRGPDGVDYPGCWDRDRGAWELPRRADGTVGLDGKTVGYITVDPSPTRYWSIQAWVHHFASGQSFLLDLHRERMEAPDFLDWSHGLQAFTGMAEDWWHSFAAAGVPLGYLIVEKNAAQRFMLQYDHFHRWTRLRRVHLIPHSTQYQNKADSDYGIQMLRPLYQHGLVRLPGRTQDPGRLHALRLVDEVTRYPHAATDDCVLGQWFGTHNLTRLRPPEHTGPPRRQPSWLGHSLLRARTVVGGGPRGDGGPRRAA